MTKYRVTIEFDENDDDLARDVVKNIIDDDFGTATKVVMLQKEGWTEIGTGPAPKRGRAS